MGLSPAWFPISSQRIGGEPELFGEVDNNLLFLYDIKKISKI
jgi:hypothetical protein